MLKKRIVIAAITLGLCLPALSSATPLMWAPHSDLLGGISRLWDFLAGAHHGTPAPAARDHRKNGPGIDPTGSPTSPDPGSQSTTTDPTVTGQ
ncbi:MAG TPA: hypothetical protein VFR03_04870 [Thermoanaerobaculia bacterium]|nr:hypothetical protein [Thermoanaerobaculia bacterium]